MSGARNLIKNPTAKRSQALLWKPLLLIWKIGRILLSSCLLNNQLYGHRQSCCHLWIEKLLIAVDIIAQETHNLCKCYELVIAECLAMSDTSLSLSARFRGHYVRGDRVNVRARCRGRVLSSLHVKCLRQRAVTQAATRSLKSQHLGIQASCITKYCQQLQP